MVRVEWFGQTEEPDMVRVEWFGQTEEPDMVRVLGDWTTGDTTQTRGQAGG